MSILAIDLGATKLAAAVFDNTGKIYRKDYFLLKEAEGGDIGNLFTEIILKNIDRFYQTGNSIEAIGVCVPGIYNSTTKTVWAPNIPGWENYPLEEKIAKITDLPVIIDSDRSCYILGEAWKGCATGCRNAIYLAVGSGIGAGIFMNGQAFSGSNGIAGAIGWMALTDCYKAGYEKYGCFEYHASGDGIARVANEYLDGADNYHSALSQPVSSHHIFEAYKSNDVVAVKVMDECVCFWGKAIANLVSLFNPEKIILGGGVFGPAAQFKERILAEAKRWAQPIAIQQVSIEISTLGNDTGLYGAAYTALKKLKKHKTS